MAHRKAIGSANQAAVSGLQIRTDLSASGVRSSTPARNGLRAFLHSLLSFVRSHFRRPRLARKVGPYRLSEQIGRGGMGVVYKASHRRLRGSFAIKLLAPECSNAGHAKRFEREAQLASSLRHPATISVSDFGTTADGAPYLAMEYVEGPDLQALVESEGPLPAPRVARILGQLAGALDELHRRGFYHGDVKPANVVVCRRGGSDDRVKLLDFGLAGKIGSDARDEGDHRVTGTPLYLSPETLLDPRHRDGRSDLYALGALGYFLLTGVPPFVGTNVLEVLTQHVYATPATPSKRAGATVPRALEELIMSCLAKSPERRPGNAAVVGKVALELERPNYRTGGPTRARDSHAAW